MESNETYTAQSALADVVAARGHVQNSYLEPVPFWAYASSGVLLAVSTAATALPRPWSIVTAGIALILLFVTSSKITKRAARAEEAGIKVNTYRTLRRHKGISAAAIAAAAAGPAAIILSDELGWPGWYVLVGAAVQLVVFLLLSWRLASLERQEAQSSAAGR